MITARLWLAAVPDEETADNLAYCDGERQKRRAGRRNEWDMIAGKLDGTPCVHEGITFPVYAEARRRKGWPDVPNAIETPGHPAPAIGPNRWTGHVPKTKATKPVLRLVVCNDKAAE